ncbi:V-type proton ATPase catalytic subunit A, partial [Stegodyphus mimosarum]
MMRNMMAFYDLAFNAVQSTAQSENRITWNVIREGMDSIIYALSNMKFMDPIELGEKEIKRRFDELYENMQQAFRNLED